MPPPTTVHSGGAIVASLERPVGGKQPLSGPKTFVFALATAGIGPLLYDRFVWQQQARGQRSRLWHLADYLAARGLPDHRDDADRCGPKLTGLVLLIAIAQAALLAWSLYTGRIRLTLWSHDPWFFAYVGLAVAGYLAIALDMLLHHHLVARVVRQFGLSETVPTALPTPKPPLFVGAVLALAVGWYWAIPAILGSGVLRKEVDKNGRKWSVDLAAGVRAQPDLLDGPPPRLHANIRQCQTPRCATDLSPTAKFCPQCGVQARKVTLVT
ncbi:MAG: zinc ribbon domain-containing protein [Planctomycetota bacterium]